MIEAAATCQRNMLSEIKVARKCKSKITFTTVQRLMIKDGGREETGKFAACSGYTYKN